MLVTSGLGFKMSSDCKKPSNSILIVIKQLVIKTFSRPGTDMSIPYLVVYLD